MGSASVSPAALGERWFWAGMKIMGYGLTGIFIHFSSANACLPRNGAEYATYEYVSLTEYATYEYVSLC